MKIMRWLWKALLWLIAAIIGLGLVTYIVLLAINWRDEPPSPAAIRLAPAFQGRPSIPDAENAYVYLIGLSAKPHEDPQTWARKRIADIRAALDQERTPVPISFADEDYVLSAHRTPAMNVLSEACRQADRKCLKALSSDQDVAAWLDSERWLLDRYKRLLAHKAWVETLPLDIRAPFPNYLTALEGQKLLLAEAWRGAGSRDSTRVKGLLESDLIFWRHVLESADILVSKNIALVAIKRHFGVGNLVLRRLPPNIVSHAVPATWRKPISNAERSMLRSLTGEWVFSDKGVRQLKQGTFPSNINPIAWWFIKPMLQAQATSNGHAETLLRMAQTIDTPYRKLPVAFAQVQQQDLVRAEAFALDPYNVIGSLFVAVGSGEFSKYTVRPSDLEGLRRVALLVIELRSRGVKPEQVPQTLRTAELLNPYTDEPFQWDEREHSIVFTGLEPSERGRHAVLY